MALRSLRKQLEMDLVSLFNSNTFVIFVVEDVAIRVVYYASLFVRVGWVFAEG